MKFANLDPQALDLALPWQDSPEQDKRFKRVLVALLVFTLLFASLVPWLPVFEKELEQPEPTITKTELILEPAVVETEPEPEPEPAPEPEPEPTPQPQQEESSRVAKSQPQPAAPPAPEEAPPKTKESVAKEQGLSKLEEQLASVRGRSATEALRRKNLSKSDLGRREYSRRDRVGEEMAAKRSRGIETDEIMEDEDVSLAAYSGVAVEATAESADPGGSALAYLSGQSSRRDMENIRRTFEAAKSSVYSLYLQALNEDPNLEGKFIFRLVIEPDGSISELELVSSELGVRSLEQTILERIRSINFGEKNVSPTAVEYAFSFLPS